MQRARDAQGHGDVVGGAPGLQLVDEPQPLLREGQRQRAITRHGRWRRRLGCAAVAPRGLEAQGKRLERGRLEQGAEGQFHAEGGPDERDEPCGQQRVAAQLEEVVLEADSPTAQQSGPQGGQPLLRVRARCHVLTLPGVERLGSGQRTPVHLAIGRQGQCVQQHQCRGHHVLGQRPTQEVLERLRVRAGRHEVRHQSLVTRRVLAHHRYRFPHAGVPRQRRLDLARLDAEAAQLHLVVGTAEELEGAIGQPPHAVPGPVQPLAVPKGTGHEALRRQLRTADVAPRQSSSAHVQLARHAHGDGLHGRVQHVRRRVADGPANGHRAGAHLLLPFHPVAGGERRVLRRAIPVDEHLSGGEPLPHPHDGQHVSAGQHLLHPGEGLGLVRLQLLEEGGCQPQGGDCRPGQRPAELLQRGRPRRVHHQLRAVQQRAPQLQRRGVEGDGRQLQPDLVRPEARKVRVQHQSRHRAVWHAHALRLARRAGGEHDVGQVGTAHAGTRRGVQGRLQGRPPGVHAHHLLAGLGHRAGQLLLGHQHGDASLALHPRAPLRRVAGVQRDVHAARLEDAQHADHQVQRALHAQAHSRFRAHAQAAQVVRQLVGPPVQRVVRQLLVPVLHRHRVRRLQHLRFEQLRQRRVSRVRGRRPTPRLHHPAPLRGSHQRQLAQPLPGPGDGGLQQHPYVLQQPPGRVRLEQVAVVVEHRGGTLRRLPHQQREVELRREVARLHSLQGQAMPELHLRRGRVLQRQRHLEEGVAAQVSPGLELLHQFLEGDVLVRIRAERHLAHLGQQLAEGGQRGGLRPQHQRVDEEADEPFGLRMRASGDGGADAEVVLPRVAREDRLVCRQQHHEGRGALLLCQRLRAVPQRLRPRLLPDTAAEPLGGQARLVARQLQRAGGSVQLLAPVVELRLQRLPLQPLPLPHRVVRVLHRQLGQGRGLALREGLVERGHFPDEHPRGPAVGDDVVQVEQQHVVGGAALQQQRTHQRAGVQGEGPPRVLVHPAPRLGLRGVLIQPAEVHRAQRQLRDGRDDLHGSSVLLTEGRAQDFVPPDQLLECALQRGHLERPVQPHRGGDVVEGAAGFQPVEEPQALLGEGQRQRTGARHGDQRGACHTGLGGARGVDASGQLRHGGRLEEVAQRQVEAERRAHARHQLRGHERVAAQVEEVVVGAHALGAQQLREEAGELALRLGARLHVLLAVAARGLRCGQGLAVHLAVGRQRQRR